MFLSGGVEVIKRVLILVLIVMFYTITMAGVERDREIELIFESGGMEIQNIMEIEDENLFLLQEKLSFYKSFGNIRLLSIFDKGAYNLEMDESGEFIGRAKITLTDFLKAGLYGNYDYNREYIGDYEVYYTYDGGEFAYAYDSETLYFSSSFSKIKDFFMEDKLEEGFSKDEESFYRYYKKENYIVKEGYIVNGIEFYSFVDRKETLYLLSDFREENIKVVENLEDVDLSLFFGEDEREEEEFFVKREPVEKVVIKDGANEYLDMIVSDLMMSGESNYKSVVNYFESRTELCAYKESKDYFVLYSSSGWDGILEVVKESYEKSFLFDESLDYFYIGEGVAELKLPLIGLNKYFMVVADKYLISSSKVESLIAIENREYFDVEYENIKQEMITKDKKVFWGMNNLHLEEDVLVEREN